MENDFCKFCLEKSICMCERPGTYCDRCDDLSIHCIGHSVRNPIMESHNSHGLLPLGDDQHDAMFGKGWEKIQIPPIIMRDHNALLAWMNEKNKKLHLKESRLKPQKTENEQIEEIVKYIDSNDLLLDKVIDRLVEIRVERMETRKV